MLFRRVTETGGNDLKTIYRPCTLDELLGNNELKRVLNTDLSKNKLKHTILFSGPAGTGKTTLARILALSLNCEEFELPTLTPCLKCSSCKSILNQNNIDILEVNVGSDSGKAEVAAIVKDLQFSTFKAKFKVIIFDECHKLTTAAKDLLLKPMEDTLEHVYLIFCTNQPEKLVGPKNGDNPFLDRCEHYVLKPLLASETLEALINIAQFEGIDYREDVLNYIVDLSKGVPRKAIGALSTAAADGSWDISAIKNLLGNELIGEDDAEIIELSRILLKAQYGKSIKLFSALVKKYPTESVRVAVAGYFVACLKRSDDFITATKISKSLDVLLPSIFQTGKPGEHIMYNNIFKVVKIMQGK